MKRRFFSGLLLALSLLFLAACDSRKPASNETSAVIATLEKGKAYTIESIKPELRKLLEFLKANPHVITPEVLVKAAERHATVMDLGLSEKFPAEFPLENGNTFEVYVELFNGSVDNARSMEEADAYFVLDLDRYPEEASAVDPDDVHDFTVHVAATASNTRKNLYTGPESSRQLRLESNTQQVDYLLFFVGGEEHPSQADQDLRYQQWVNSRPGLAKAQVDPNTQYWWITRIKLDNKKDSSSEEFELYYGPNGYDGTGNPFDYYAKLLFNGTWQTDASGISRHCPDINSKNIYVPSHPIAIEVLTPDSPLGFKICPIEDDCTAGYHKNGGQGTYNFNMNAYDIDVFNWFNRTYAFTIIDNCSDDDDIYNNSGTISFGASPYVCAYSWPSAPYVRVCLRRGTVGEADSNWGGVACPLGTACGF